MALAPDRQVELSVIVPVFNNAGTLPELHQRISRAVLDAGISFELLFVDDAGPDDSLAVINKMIENHPQISVVVMKHNVGQHAAVLHGLRFARGECCVVMDADLQDPPESLPLLWQSRSSGCFAVFAGRCGKYQGTARMLTSRVYKRVLHWLTGIPADAGIFVLMERQMVLALLQLPVRTPFINTMIGLTGMKVCSVPVERNVRYQGVSSYSAWGRLRSALMGLFNVLEYKWNRRKISYLEGIRDDPVRKCYGEAFGDKDG